MKLLLLGLAMRGLKEVLFLARVEEKGKWRVQLLGCWRGLSCPGNRLKWERRVSCS
jgi:hypothetical protein